MEEIIMQMRSKENIDEIRLSIVRDYLYARCSFFRRGKLYKDIRVIVDKAEFWEDKTVDELLLNKEFMDKATSKLTKAMEGEIQNSVYEYNKMLENTNK
jgi:hypothetical protein